MQARNSMQKYFATGKQGSKEKLPEGNVGKRNGFDSSQNVIKKLSSLNISKLSLIENQKLNIPLSVTHKIQLDN